MILYITGTRVHVATFPVSSEAVISSEAPASGERCDLRRHVNASRQQHVTVLYSSGKQLQSGQNDEEVRGTGGTFTVSS